MNTMKNTSGLSSIRNRILIFSVLVTLVPSFGMGWFFYDMTYRAMAEKTRQRFIDSSGKVEREMDLWLAERQHDLHVFANSFILIDNLTGYLDTKGADASKHEGDQGLSPVKKISGYLDLVRNKFADYKRLAVFDGEGREVAASDADTEDTPFQLPADWKAKIANDKAFIGEVTFKTDKSIPLAVIGIPLVSDRTDRQLGVLAVQISLQGLLPILGTAFSGGDVGPWAVHLVQKDGRLVLAVASPEGQEETALSAGQKLQLFTHPLQLENFNNKKWIVGFAMAFKNLPWGLVITESYDYVYADVIRTRDQIILTAILFTLIIGLGASIVVRQIIQPLKALTGGVLRVAEGELDISLDVIRNDELGIVTGMFNEMVVRLQQNKQELERLAVTDVLTRLANRKQIMTVLNTHIENYRRYGNEFSLLMVDIDNFKMINDTHGHLVGDSVLVQVAQIFNKLLRTMDVAGRYGGEEFLIILGQTDIRKAMLTAERIRKAVEQYPFVYQDVELHITISAGVAGIKSVRDTDNSLIGRADTALYEAKGKGRNRVVLSGEEAVFLEEPSEAG
jgi:diguanylate cyclase (GGDEF)-like protein